MKNLFKLILLIALSSCSVANWYKPMGYRLFRTMPEGGTPGFELGWIHGCESGLGTQFGGGIYQSFYTWKRDPDITSSNPDIAKIRTRYKKELKKVNWDNLADVKKNFSDYNSIFWGAHYYCRQSVLGSMQASGANPTLPGEARLDPSSSNFQSVGSVWKLNGRGDTRIGSTGLW